MKGKVIAINDETPESKTDVNTFIFQLEGPIFCKPGQCIGMIGNRDVLEGYARELYDKGDYTQTAYDEALKRLGKSDGIRRMYSIVSLQDPNLLYLEIEKHEETLSNGDPYKGVFSNFMHDRIRVGDELEFENGCKCERFVYEENKPRDYLGIAAGAGIAPIICILNQIVDRKLPVNATVIYSVKTPSDIIYKDELETLARKNKNVKVVYTATQIGEQNEDWHDYKGRISKDIIIKEATNLSNTSCFICGSVKFATAVKDMLVELGVKNDDIRISAG